MASKERPKRQAAEKWKTEFMPKQAERILGDTDDSWSPGDQTLGGIKVKVRILYKAFLRVC